MMKKIFVSILIVIMLVTGILLPQKAHAVLVSVGTNPTGTTTVYVTNNNSNSRYMTAAIYQTNSSGYTSGGTCLASNSKVILSGYKFSVTANLSTVPHAYGKGTQFKGSSYYSGIEASAAKIIK